LTKDKKFLASIKADSGLDKHCRSYISMEFSKIGSQTSLAKTTLYGVAPINNASDPSKINYTFKNNSTYKLRIERQFNVFEDVDCDDSPHNYLLRLSIPKKTAKKNNR
jgi:hypothetical protein